MVKACKFNVFISAVVLVASLAACSKTEQQTTSPDVKSLPAFIQQQGSQYAIKQGELTMEIDPAVGGRIASVKYQQHEILLTADQINTLWWGSVLWSSPQNDWNWPPVETLDSKPYSVSVEGNRLVLTSGVDERTGYQFVKRYGISDSTNHAFAITYSIYNRSDQVKTVAPWELTRIPTRGIVLFPTGERAMESGIFYPMDIQQMGEISWFSYDTKKIRRDHQKLMTDGKEGWIAYVDRGHLLVKAFADVPAHAIADNEGEIELFADEKKTYLEIQQQGVITTLQPGEHLDWDVIWYVKKLPNELSVDMGSEELVGYIRQIVNE